MIGDRGLVGIPSHSDFFERGRVEDDSHPGQHVDPVRRDLRTPGIEEESFGNHEGEMIAGPLDTDITVAQGRSEHLLQLMLHLPEPLLSRVCTSGHQHQTYQHIYEEGHGLHGFSLPRLPPVIDRPRYAVSREVSSHHEALLAPPMSNMIPPTSANPTARGVSGMVSFLSAVAWRAEVDHFFHERHR